MGTDLETQHNCSIPDYVTSGIVLTPVSVSAPGAMSQEADAWVDKSLL